MSSALYILADEGFPTLNEERERMDWVLHKLESDVRAVLKPAGFPVSSPQSWRASTVGVFTKLNCKYRRLARLDILAAAYNVRSIRRVGDVIDQVAEHDRSREEIVGLMSTFEALYNNNTIRLTPLERVAFGGVLKTFEEAIEAYKLFLDDSRQILGAYEPLFRVLDQSSLDLIWYVKRLKTPVSPRQPVEDMLPHVTALRTLQKERLALEKRGAAIYADVVGIILTRGYMRRDAFNARFQEYASITTALKEQVDAQNAAIAELEACLSLAQAMPSVLPGLETNTVVPIADLRNAHVYFERVNEAVDNMDEIVPPLRAGLTRNIDSLNQRLAVLVIP